MRAVGNRLRQLRAAIDRNDLSDTHRNAFEGWWAMIAHSCQHCSCNEPPAGLHRDTYELAQAIAARIGGSIVVRKGWYQPRVKIVRKWTEAQGWFTMTLFRNADGEHTIGVEMANIAEGDARELIERLFPKAAPKKRRRRRVRA